MTVAALLISVVAVVIAMGAAWYGRTQKLAAGSAARAAEDAARAAEIAARAAADSALESLTGREMTATADTADAAADPEPAPDAGPGQVAWEITCTRQHHYVLRNTGVDPAYRVDVEPHDVSSVVRATWSFPEFPAGGEELYTVVARTGSAMSITWHPRPTGSGDPLRQVLALVPR